MAFPTKDLDLDTLRPRFSNAVAALGSRIGALLRAMPSRPDPALGAEQAMIRPSPHERVAIETHREDR
jgi:hypothetical protein